MVVVVLCFVRKKFLIWLLVFFSNFGVNFLFCGRFNLRMVWELFSLLVCFFWCFCWMIFLRRLLMCFFVCFCLWKSLGVSYYGKLFLLFKYMLKIFRKEWIILFWFLFCCGRVLRLIFIVVELIILNVKSFVRLLNVNVLLVWVNFLICLINIFIVLSMFGNSCMICDGVKVGVYFLWSFLVVFLLIRMSEVFFIKGCIWFVLVLGVFRGIDFDDFVICFVRWWVVRSVIGMLRGCMLISMMGGFLSCWCIILKM